MTQVVESRRRIDEGELPELWQRKRDGDPRAVARLVEMYAFRAEQLARDKKAPEYVELEDMISWAMFGLFDAVRKFDPETSDGRFHTHFYAFASMRIRGAILDGMKAPYQTWASRKVWRQIQDQKAVEDVLTQQLGRHVSRMEIAREMGVELDDLVYLRQQVPVSSTSFEGDDEDEQCGEGAWIGDEDAEAEGDTNLLIARLATCIASLSKSRQAALWRAFWPHPVSPVRSDLQAAIQGLLQRFERP